MISQCETYQVQPNKPTHGYSGPLKVSYGGFNTEVAQEFLNVAAQYDKTRGQTDDVNDLYGCNKYGVRLLSGHNRGPLSDSVVFQRSDGNSTNWFCSATSSGDTDYAFDNQMD